MPKNWDTTHNPEARPKGCNGRYGSSGSNRHRRAGETPCARCKRSEAHYARELRRGQGLKRQPPQPCGTNAAHKRHGQRGEPIDLACRLGRAAYRAEQRAKRAQQLDAA